jgi:hypothetical protein
VAGSVHSGPDAPPPLSLTPFCLPLAQAAGVVASEANGVGSSGGEGGRTVYVGSEALSFKRDDMEARGAGARGAGARAHR